MRAIVRSKTYQAQLKRLLELGAARFGTTLVEQKLATLDLAIEQLLAVFPRTKTRDPYLGLVVYPVTDTRSSWSTITTIKRCACWRAC